MQPWQPSPERESGRPAKARTIPSRRGSTPEPRSVLVRIPDLRPVVSDPPVVVPVGPSLPDKSFHAAHVTPPPHFARLPIADPPQSTIAIESSTSQLPTLPLPTIQPSTIQLSTLQPATPQQATVQPLTSPTLPTASEHIVHAPHAMNGPHYPRVIARQAEQRTSTNNSTTTAPTASTIPTAPKVPAPAPIPIAAAVSAPLSSAPPSSTPPVQPLEERLAAIEREQQGRRWDWARIKKLANDIATIAKMVQWAQRPKVIITAVTAVLLQFTGLAFLMEMGPTTTESVAPPTPQSRFAPSAGAPTRTAREIPRPLNQPAQSPATVVTPLSNGTSPSSGKSSPTMTPTSPRFQETPRLGDPQDKLPWEEMPPSSKPVAPDTSARRTASKDRMAAVPTESATPEKKKARLLGDIHKIDTPRQP